MGAVETEELAEETVFSSWAAGVREGSRRCVIEEEERLLLNIYG